MLSLLFGQWYSGLVFLFTFSFDRDSAIWMDAFYTLVTTVSYGVSVVFEVNFGVFEQSKVMGFAGRKVRSQNLLALFADDYLAFLGVAFLLP